MYQIHYTGKFYKGLTLEMRSPQHSTTITYEVGETYTADGFEVSDEPCAPGIHFVHSIAQALKWGPVVVDIEIPEGSHIVWGPDKSRDESVTVVSIVNLAGSNLGGANLRGAD